MSLHRSSAVRWLLWLAGSVALADVRAGAAIVSGRTATVTASDTTLFTLAEATAGTLITALKRAA